MSDILKKILAVKREEVATASSARPLAAIRAEAEAQSAPRDFVGAIHSKVSAGETAPAAKKTAAKKAPAKKAKA